MFSKYKYNFVLELEKRYKESFLLNKTKQIALLPPLLKRIGIRYFLVFMVVSQPKNSESHRAITRPIGLVLVRKNARGRERIFDIEHFEFCTKRNDFELEYFNLETHKNFWPNRIYENEENYRISLEQLLKISHATHLFKRPNKKEYDKYLARIKKMFPEHFHIFYDELQKNRIVPVGKAILDKRQIAKEEHEERLKRIKEKLKKDRELKKELFFVKLKSTLVSYLKEEIVPSLKNKGSYTKLLFYEKIGLFLKNLRINLENFSDCFDPFLSFVSQEKNYERVLEELKIEIIKIYSKSCSNVLYRITAVDTLSKVLIVFLNAMLIEEIHDKILPQAEREIQECKSIFNEDINVILNEEAKQFLIKIFMNLCEDYYILEEEKLSNIYFGYSTIHKVRPVLSLIEVKD